MRPKSRRKVLLKKFWDSPELLSDKEWTEIMIGDLRAAFDKVYSDVWLSGKPVGGA